MFFLIPFLLVIPSTRDETPIFQYKTDDDQIVSHDAPRFMLYCHCVRNIL